MIGSSILEQEFAFPEMTSTLKIPHIGTADISEKFVKLSKLNMRYVKKYSIKTFY
jgi:hypothetical protein